MKRVLPLPVLLFALLFAGCIDRGKPSPMIESYSLEYPTPAFGDLSPLDQAVKVERFSVAKAYNTLSMVYRPEPYKLDTYASNRWMVNPGDMVSDFLLRDLRSSGLFRAAFSFRDYEDARFVIQGGVEEFLEKDAGNGRSAALTLSVTLIDLSRPAAPNRLIFQKKYSFTEAIAEHNPEGLARAMSTGMAKVSALIIRDVYQALRGL
jgi:cholesterol transport system auxiliary component